MRFYTALGTVTGLAALVLLASHDLQETMSQALIHVFGFGNALAAVAAFLLADATEKGERR